MAAKFVHAIDTRYKPARKIRVPEQYLDIFPYLEKRDPARKQDTPPAPNTNPAVASVVEAAQKKEGK